MSTFKQPPNEKRGNKTYEDFRVSTHYSDESDVYGAIGQTNATIMKITSSSTGDVTTQINKFIGQADERIRRMMGIPITVRKEGHEFFNNPIVQLGPDREDPFEVFGDYDPSDKVEDIFAIYYNEYRIKIPYPKDFDQFTEPTEIAHWGVNGSSIKTETVIGFTDYTDCISADVGLNVGMGDSHTVIGTLKAYDNVTKTWVITVTTETDIPASTFLEIVNGNGQGTTVADSIYSTNSTVITTDTTDFKCGTASLMAVVGDVSSKASIYYPSTKNLHKRIYPWFYIGFYAKCSDPSATFTFRIVRSTGSYYYGTFNLTNTDTWEPVMLNIRRFQFANAGGEGAQPDFNWILTNTEWIEITCDKVCTFKIDNLCFNDGFFATYPEGTISWCMPEWYPMGRVSVTYSFDPFKDDVPPALLEASSKLAGVLVLDWIIGYRQSKIAFDEMSDTLSESPDRETLENTRRRLENEAMEALSSLGFKGYGGIG